MTLRMTGIIIGLTAVSFLSIAARLGAGTTRDTAPVITYTASGTFASPATSGADTFRLAGEPFKVSIAVSAATAPSQNGPNWAVYNNLKLTGTVHSGLLGPTPINIISNMATITQAINPGQYDLFTMESPINVVGVSLTIKAPIAMPPGTIVNQLLHPFNPVTLAPGNATVSYAQGGESTTLAVKTGSLTATIPSATGTRNAGRSLENSSGK